MTIEIRENTDPRIVRIFFIRHGQTDHNLKKILQGHLDIDINETGVDQAKKVGKAFESIDLDYFISSDLIRCVNTSNEILKHHAKLTMETTSNLRERNMGVVQGMYLKDALAQYGADFKNLGETKDELTSRVELEFNNALKLSEHNKFKNVAICTHGGVLTAFMNYLYENKNFQLGNQLTRENLRVPFNTSISVVDYDFSSKQGTIQTFGNTDHLGGQFEVKDQLLR